MTTTTTTPGGITWLVERSSTCAAAQRAGTLSWVPVDLTATYRTTSGATYTFAVTDGGAVEVHRNGELWAVVETVHVVTADGECYLAGGSVHDTYGPAFNSTRLVEPAGYGYA